MLPQVLIRTHDVRRDARVHDAGQTRRMVDVLNVEQRFGLHDGRKRSYREVGEELGVTAEAARRMVKRAVTAVRNEAASRIDAA